MLQWALHRQRPDDEDGQFPGKRYYERDLKTLTATYKALADAVSSGAPDAQAAFDKWKEERTLLLSQIAEVRWRPYSLE